MFKHGVKVLEIMYCNTFRLRFRGVLGGLGYASSSEKI